MKKQIILMILIVFALTVFTVGYSIGQTAGSAYDEAELRQTFSDWVLGTDYGIEAVVLDGASGSITITIPQVRYELLEDYQLADIQTGICDILAYFGISGGFVVSYATDDSQELETAAVSDIQDAGEQPQTEAAQAAGNGETINLIFIHHSVGGNWLIAGLNELLNANHYHVADISYGWRTMGDRTDTADWPDWFNDTVMPKVYTDFSNSEGYNTIAAAAGENTIIMFKSCYPNSDVGDSIDDEKTIYKSLLGYFTEHPDKMFILITPPPMQQIPYAEKTRELTNWLVSPDGWREGYLGNNLYVF